MGGAPNNACWLGLIAGALLVGLAPAAAQTPPWVDPTLLDAAKKEGTLVVYSSTNEQEGLPLFKLFEQATGIKVQYVRGSDSVLTSRMSIEFRAGQHAYDIVHMTTINKLPQQMLAQYEPPEAKNISSAARDKDRRWYGVFANYNSPSYNTKMVKPEQLPKSYEEFSQRKEWAGKVAIDGTDNEWLRALYIHYGKEKAERITRDMVTNLKPVVTDGHLALARANGAGEYWLTLNNYVNLTLNVKIRRRVDRFLRARSGGTVLRAGRYQFQGAASERGEACRELPAQPAGAGVLHQIRPAADALRRDAEPGGRGQDAREPQGRAGAVQSGGRAHVAEDFCVHVQAAVGHGSTCLVLLCL